MYVLPPTDLLLPTWFRLERDGVKGIVIVPMSPAASWWTIMKGGLISKLQTFLGTSLTIPYGCAKINTHDKLTNTEYAILDIKKSARRSLWQTLSTPSIHALNRLVQQDLDLERSVASQDW